MCAAHNRGMSYNPDQPRNPANGQWVDERNTPSGVSLIERLDAMDDGADVRATVTASPLSAHTTKGIEDWWNRAFLTGETNHRGSVPRMPDDNTPNMHTGLSVTGHRRTYRRRYDVGDGTIRMPSRTAINRFLTDNDLTAVDVPVLLSENGRDTQAFVRVTRNNMGQFEAWALGTSGELDVRMSESVMAALERRHREVASVDDLIARRSQRRSLYGVRVDGSNGTSFISGLAYDETSSTVTVAIGDRAYQYVADRRVYEQMQRSNAPGHVFNDQLRGKIASRRLDKCPSCGRFAGQDHVCPIAAPASYASSTFIQHIGAKRLAPGFPPKGSRPTVQQWVYPGGDGELGWSRHAISAVLYDHADKDSVPRYFREKPNGANGVLHFDGLGRRDVDKLATLMPENERWDNSWALKASRIPEVKLGGWVSSPTKGEHMTFTRATISDTKIAREIRAMGGHVDERSSTWRKLAATYGLPKPSAPMSVSVDERGDVVIDL